MNETTRRRILSIVCILGFFVGWEVLCLIFNVSDIVLPRPSQILITLWTRFPAIWPHARTNALHDAGRVRVRNHHRRAARNPDRLLAPRL